MLNMLPWQINDRKRDTFERSQKPFRRRLVSLFGRIAWIQTG